MESDWSAMDFAELLNEDQLDEFKQIFTLFDYDGDGEITLKELEVVLKTLDLSPTESELEYMARKVKASGKDTVDFRKFLNIIPKSIVDMDVVKDVRVAFEVLDEAQTGCINGEAVRKLLKTIVHKRTQDAEANLSAANGDEFFFYEEVVRLFYHK